MSKSAVTYQSLYNASRRHKRILRIFTCVLLLAMVGFLFYAHTLLKEYESVQPKYVAQEYLDRINGGEYALFTVTEEALKAGLAEDYLLAIQDKRGTTDLTIKEDPSAPRGKKYYTLLLRRTKFGRLVLAESAATSSHGFAQWEFDAAEINDALISLQCYTVRAPESSEVYVDGAPLDRASAVQTGLRTELMKYLPSDAYSFSECMYELSTYSRVPEISARDRNGVSQEVVRNGNAFTALINYDAATDPELSARAEQVLAIIADFTVGQTSFTRASSFVVPNSNARDLLYEYSKWKSATAAHGHLENIDPEYYLTTGENSFCCHIRADYYCSYDRRDDTVYHLDYTMYFQRVDGVWLLYDFQNAAEPS